MDEREVLPIMLGRTNSYICNYFLCGEPSVGVFEFLDLNLIGAHPCRSHAFRLLPKMSTLKNWRWLDSSVEAEYIAEQVVVSLGAPSII